MSHAVLEAPHQTPQVPLDVVRIRDVEVDIAREIWAIKRRNPHGLSEDSDWTNLRYIIFNSQPKEPPQPEKVVKSLGRLPALRRGLDILPRIVEEDMQESPYEQIIRTFLATQNSVN